MKLPPGKGFNYVLIIFQSAFKTQIPAAIVAAPAIPAVAALPPPVIAADDITKQQMVQSLSQHSRMNLEYSTK